MRGERTAFIQTITAEVTLAQFCHYQRDTLHKYRCSIDQVRGYLMMAKPRCKTAKKSSSALIGSRSEPIDVFGASQVNNKVLNNSWEKHTAIKSSRIFCSRAVLLSPSSLPLSFIHQRAHLVVPFDRRPGPRWVNQGATCHHKAALSHVNPTDGSLFADKNFSRG